MKLKHVLMAGFCAVLITAASCKKDKDEEKPKTTAERIQARWSLDNYLIHAHDDDQDTSLTIPGSTGDYFDIRSDNKVYLTSNQGTDTLTYSLPDDSTMVINGLGIFGDNGTYRIRNLTDNTLALYSKESDPTSATGYAELTFNLKK